MGVIQTESFANSPLYLGTGNTVNGCIASTTHVAPVTDFFNRAGSRAVGTAYEHGSATNAVHMRFERGDPAWGVLVRYDTSGGTEAHYTTDSAANWSSATVSSAVDVRAGTNGAIFPGGIFLSMTNPGRAYTTAFVLDADYSCGEDVDLTASNGSFATSASNPFGYAAGTWVNGSGWQSTFVASYYRIGLRKTCYGNQVNRVSWTVTTSANTAFGVVVKRASDGANLDTCYYSNTGIVSHFTDTCSFTAFTGDVIIEVYANSGGSFYFEGFSLFNSGGASQAGTRGAGFYTSNHGAAWTEITGAAANVPLIEPGFVPSGSIAMPISDTTHNRAIYGYTTQGTSAPIPALRRTVSSTHTDISPSASGKSYGVYGRRSSRQIAICDEDPNSAILCGVYGNGAGTYAYRVFLTRNVWAATPTWTALNDESASDYYTGVYFTHYNTAFLFGVSGAVGLWTGGSTILDKRGDIADLNPGDLCGLVGG